MIQHLIRKKISKFACCKSIESIYHLRNLNIFLLYSFLSNLLQSLISSSKPESAVNGKLYPGGSYQIIQSWLEEQESPPRVFAIFFDNIGKYIIYNYHISLMKSKSADIISAKLHIILNRNSTLQSQIELIKH